MNLKILLNLHTGLLFTQNKTPLEFTLISLCSNEGKAAKNTVDALSLVMEKANMSESVAWFNKNKVLLRYDLIRGLRVFPFELFISSKIVPFLQLAEDMPSIRRNTLSTSLSVNVNILLKVSLSSILGPEKAAPVDSAPWWHTAR